MPVPALAAAPIRFTRRRSGAGLLLAAGLPLLLVLSSPAARADAYAEVNRLIQARDLAQALQRTEQHLVTKPRDPQMRFLQGVIHSEAGRQAEAEAVFTRLTQEFPELPEPYNNLAVILGGKGQWEQARQLLETAVQLDPSYATAFENLGDIHAQLSSRAWAQAQKIDPKRTHLERKLKLARDLLTPAPSRANAPATRP